MLNRRMRALLLSAAIFAAPVVLADVETAKGYVKEAKEAVDSRSYEDAAKKLELAEVELDGVDAAAREPIQKSIDEVKAQIAEAQGSANKTRYTRQLELIMHDAEDAIGNLVTWPGVEEKFNELADDATAKAALGDDLTKARSKFATFKKLHARKASVKIKEQLGEEEKRFDEQWAEAKKTLNDPEASPNSKSSAGDDMLRAIESLRKSASQLPEDDAAAKSLKTKLDGIETDVVKLAMAERAKQKLESLNSSWANYEEDFKGWEDEKPLASFDDYGRHSSEMTYALGRPKTRDLLVRSKSWMENLQNDDEFKTLQAVPEVKAFGDKITKLNTDAQALMEAAAVAMVESVEKSKITNDNLTYVNSIKDGLERNIAGSSKLTDLQGRLQKMIDGFEKATAGAEEAKVAAYKELKAKAEADWPAMKAKYSPESGFDPNNPKDFRGKTILITTHNLMRYRFKAGDFPFATTLNGLPVAGKYDPVVARAIDEVESKIGRNLGDSDDDGKWEIIAIVDGTTGQMMQRKQASGDVTVDGQKAGTYQEESAVPVDAPIITIIAAHCGPLSVSKE